MNKLVSALLSLVLISAAAESMGAEQAINSVVTAKVEYKDMTDELAYPARVSNTRNVAVPAEIDGRVSSLKAVLGQHVAQGALLMTLRNSDPIYDYRAFEVRSPLSGVVTKLEVAAADLVGKGKILVTIGDDSHLKVLTNITSDDVSHIKVGQTASLLVGGQTYKLMVKALNRQLDPITGTAACELGLASPSPTSAGILPGSIAEVRFSVNQRKALVIAQRAIVFRGRDPFVIRIQGGKKAEYVPAKILRQGLGVVEVESSVQAGDAVVVNSQGFVADGEIVKVEGQEG